MIYLDRKRWSYLPVETIHITVNVSWSGRGQEEISPKQFRHLRQRKAVETVETILRCLLLPEPDKDVTLLLAQGSPHTDHLTKLREHVPDILLGDLSVLVQEAQAIVTEDVLLHVSVELDKAILG